MNRIIPLAITVRAPYAVRGNLVGHFGIDTPLFRNAAGHLAIPGTLVIGKLAEAFHHIATTGGDAASSYRADLQHLFATSSQRQKKEEHETTHGREPRRLITASDFILAVGVDDEGGVRTRIALDGVTQTVADGMLQVLEQAAKPRDTIVFLGELRVTGRVNDNDLEVRILKACDWIIQIGGLRTVGFGEVVSIGKRDHDVDPSPPRPKVRRAPQRSLGLRLSFRDVFCVAEKRTQSNTFTSSPIVSGAAIKGAVASQILAAHGLDGLLADHAHALPQPLATLARGYDRIRFRHAFPLAKMGEASRRGPVPLSLATAGKSLVDRAGARFDGSPVLIDGEAPTAVDDWKDDVRLEVNQRFGIDHPKLDFRMRTQIDPDHRAAMEARLFAIEYTRNDTHDFIAAIDIPDDLPRRDILEALEAVLADGLAGVGRGGAYCDVTFCDPASEDIAASHVMMLKTPALLRAPDPGEFPKLHGPYQAAFDEIGLAGTGFRLKTLYVDEHLAGHAFMQNRRARPDFMPYLLTKAGSVFVFEHDDPQARLPETWFHSGLPVPSSVRLFHGLDRESDLWRVCSYVPENGYGEVLRYAPMAFEGSIETVPFIDEETE
jgi:hypothetical protein